jgi:hypothetical protein
MGTIQWKWLDDEAKENKFLIPKSYYVPDGNARLLSPQHWGKAMKDNKPLSGTRSETVHNKVTLFWNQRKNRLMIPLGTRNVAIFQLAPGCAKCSAFCAKADVDYDEEQGDPITVELSQVVSEDEDEDDIVQGSADKQNQQDIQQSKWLRSKGGSLVLASCGHTA